jgi:hypothetical protein
MRAQSEIDRFHGNSYDLVIEGESYRSRQKPRLDTTSLPSGTSPSETPSVTAADGTGDGPLSKQTGVATTTAVRKRAKAAKAWKTARSPVADEKRPSQPSQLPPGGARTRWARVPGTPKRRPLQDDADGGGTSEGARRGRDFDAVLVTGVEEGLLPHAGFPVDDEGAPRLCSALGVLFAPRRLASLAGAPLRGSQCRGDHPRATERGGGGRGGGRASRVIGAPLRTPRGWPAASAPPIALRGCSKGPLLLDSRPRFRQDEPSRPGGRWGGQCS